MRIVTSTQKVDVCQLILQTTVVESTKHFFQYILILWQWINQTTWPNSCKSTCEVTFFSLQNILLEIWEIQQKTIKNVCLSENFAKIFTVICNSWWFFQFFQNFYWKEDNRRDLLSFAMSTLIFRKMVCELKNFSYMNELMYNLVTWSD